MGLLAVAHIDNNSLGPTQPYRPYIVKTNSFLQYVNTSNKLFYFINGLLAIARI